MRDRDEPLFLDIAVLGGFVVDMSMADGLALSLFTSP